MKQPIVHRIHKDVVDSTNNFVRQLLAEGHCLSDITWVDADTQTAGRGQRGNSWESESGKNLVFSLLFHPNSVLASHQFLLSQAIALSVYKALSNLSEGFSVKWPNDIYWNDYKVSGTLIECDLMGKFVDTCIIGTGINVNQQIFRSDAPNPVSLAQILDREVNREELMQQVVRNFSFYYQLIENGCTQDIRKEYASHLYRGVGLWPFADAGGEFEAEIVGVEPTGHLLLKTSEGEERRYEFKEVRFILPSAKVTHDDLMH